MKRGGKKEECSAGSSGPNGDQGDAEKYIIASLQIQIMYGKASTVHIICTRLYNMYSLI